MKAVKTIDIDGLDKMVNDFFESHLMTSNSVIKNLDVTVNYFSIRVELTPYFDAKADRTLDNVYNIFNRDSETIQAFLNTSDYIHYSTHYISGTKLILVFTHDYKIAS